jgi:aspartate kinase
MKFGGSSLAGPEHLQRVAGIVRGRLHLRPVVVLSAMGKTTNELIAAAERALNAGEVDTAKVRKLTEGTLRDLGVPVPGDVLELLEELEFVLAGISLLQELPDRSRDLVVSFGERLSVRVFAAFFSHGARGVGAVALDSWQVGMITTSGAGSASSAYSQVEVLPSTSGAIRKHLAPLEQDYSYLPVVTGYIAQDREGTITTLGRDGSDLSATIIGAAVSASEVQIWKDVDGVLTMDPRVVKEARPLSVLTFEEAAELSAFGAKVVHPSAVMPAWKARVPMSVRNSMAPETPGTRILAELSEQDVRARAGQPVAAISSKSEITMIRICSTRMLGQHGFLAHVFQVFKKFDASVDVVATSEVTVSLTLDRGFRPLDLAGLRAELEPVGKVTVNDDLAQLTLITAKEAMSSVLRRAFDVFEGLDVKPEMVSHGASNVNVTFVIPQASLELSAKSLHSEFFEG